MKDEIANKLLQYLERSKDFLLEETPIVIQQALKYEKISCLLSMIFILVLMCVGTIIAYSCWKNPKLTEFKNWEITSIFGVIIPLLFSPVFICQFYCSLDKMIKIYIAPKYFLISLIANLKG